MASLLFISALCAAFPAHTAAQHTHPIVVGPGVGPAGHGVLPRYHGRESNFEPTTSLLVPWPRYNSGSGADVHPAFGDVDGDGRSELVLGLGYGLGGGWIAVLDDEENDYRLIRWLRVEWPWYNSARGAVYPAVGDLDGDGYAEIVAGLGRGGQGFLEIFGGSNRNYAHQRWLAVGNEPTVPVVVNSYRWSNGETHPAVGDLNGDGEAEIVVGFGEGGSGWLQIFHDASENHRYKQLLQTGWPLYNSSRSGETWPAVGDTDGNGTPEIVIGLGQGGDGWLQVLSAGATIAPRGWLQVPWPGFNTRCGASRPAIGRLGSDGPGVVVGLGECPEVVAGNVVVFDRGLLGAPRWLENRFDAEFKNTMAGTFPAVAK